VGLEPVGAKDQVVCAYGSDIEFGAFFVEVFVRSFDADGLDGSKANGSCFIGGAVNIFDG
jgi:hypothetical protein